jgi:hypothetical protein
MGMVQERIPRGSEVTTLLAYAQMLRNGGARGKEIVDYVRSANERLCDTPLCVVEVDRILGSVDIPASLMADEGLEVIRRRGWSRDGEQNSNPVYTVWLDFDSIGPWASATRRLPPMDGVALFVMSMSTYSTAELTKLQRQPIKWMGGAKPTELMSMSMCTPEGHAPRRSRIVWTGLTRMRLSLPLAITPESWDSFNIVIWNRCAVRTPPVRILLHAYAVERAQKERWERATTTCDGWIGELNRILGRG